VSPFELIEWPCPALNGERRDELALVFDRARERRLLVLPAWFDEANKLRRQTVEVMRRLDLAGIDSMLPDLPGCNESEMPLAEQTLEDWRAAADAAARHFNATNVLAIRGGALLAPSRLPGWAYAAVDGKRMLRAMLRARTIAAREAGRAERTEDLRIQGRERGIELGGWQIGPSMFGALEQAALDHELTEIDQSAIGGAGLWLRAEPDEDPEQADALAALVTMGMTSS
jgi:hypothetical protein